MFGILREFEGYVEELEEVKKKLGEEIEKDIAKLAPAWDQFLQNLHDGNNWSMIDRSDGGTGSALLVPKAEVSTDT